MYECILVSAVAHASGPLCQAVNMLAHNQLVNLSVVVSSRPNPADSLAAELEVLARLPRHDSINGSDKRHVPLDRGLCIAQAGHVVSNLCLRIFAVNPAYSRCLRLQ